MPPTVYLVSGATRGIGLGIVTALASREDVFVFAGARNPTSSPPLQELASKYPEKLRIIKLTSADKAENAAAAAEIKAVAGRLDVVVANAALIDSWGPASDVPADKMLEHYQTNTVGTLMLFQSTFALLNESSPNPKFVILSSLAGSIGSGAPVFKGAIAYGCSKAAINYMMRKIHFENERWICFSIHPGIVATDMFVTVSKVDEAVSQMPHITVDESVQGILKEIDNATRENAGGQFLDNEGGRIDW